MSTAKILCLLILAIHLPQLALANGSSQPHDMIQPPATGNTLRRADFRNEAVSPQAMATANWIVDSGDNQDMPFMLIDKRQAQVLVFTAEGQLSGATPALLGLAVGDDSVPGIGERSLASIRPEERTTPAGRFVASLGTNLKGREILWVDYEQALSLHPVVTGNPKERRAERLASPNGDDNRISYGCINVPEHFFQEIVSSTFRQTSGIVYVLPEIRPIHTVFASYYEVQ